MMFLWGRNVLMAEENRMMMNDVVDDDDDDDDDDNVVVDDDTNLSLITLPPLLSPQATMTTMKAPESREVVERGQGRGVSVSSVPSCRAPRAAEDSCLPPPSTETGHPTNQPSHHPYIHPYTHKTQTKQPRSVH